MSTWFLAESEGDVWILHTNDVIPNPVHKEDIVDEEWKVIEIFSPKTSAVLDALYHLGQDLHFDHILETLHEIVDLAVQAGRTHPTSS